MKTKQVQIRFQANDPNDPRHELALARFAAVLNVRDYGQLVLSEVKNVETEELEYIIGGSWESEDSRTHFIPVAKLFMDDHVKPVYALPDGEGGYLDVIKHNSGEPIH